MMLSKLLIVLIGVLLQSCLKVVSAEVSSLDEDDRRLSTSQIQFALDFFKSSASNGQPNSIMSAFSVSTLFTMLYQGSGGDTAQEIRKGLGYDKADLNKTEVMSVFKKLLTDVQTNPNLAISNSLWNSKSFEVLESYRQVLSECFHAEERQLDFSSTNATDIINAWVSSSTKGMIQELFQEPLDASTLLVLVNAVYFKGTWKTKFSPNNTMDLLFTNNDNSSDTNMVPMMNITGKFKYYENQTRKVKCIELDYAGDKMSMIMMLPTGENGLKDIEKNLTEEALLDCFEQMFMAKVNVTIPKFKIESNYNLLPIMQSLGVRQVFSGMANLIGISSQRGLYVTEAVQKAAIQVDEDGTEAGAASGAATARSFMPTKKFLANHPFLYFVKEKPSNLIWFMGRVAEF